MKTKKTILQIGTKFGKLTVQGEAGSKQFGGYKVRMITVKCFCGNVLDVTYPNLKSGVTRSCGCNRLNYRMLKLGSQPENKIIHPRTNKKKLHNITLMELALINGRGNINRMWELTTDVLGCLPISYQEPEVLTVGDINF